MNANFLNNLNKNLKDGPKEKEEPKEAKPLEHLTKGRAAGPKKRMLKRKKESYQHKNEVIVGSC